jgi:hypothetical protein
MSPQRFKRFKNCSEKLTQIVSESAGRARPQRSADPDSAPDDAASRLESDGIPGACMIDGK